MGLFTSSETKRCSGLRTSCTGQLATAKLQMKENSEVRRIKSFKEDLEKLSGIALYYIWDAETCFETRFLRRTIRFLEFSDACRR